MILGSTNRIIFKPAAPSPTQLLLNKYEGAAAAYSLRLLNANYSGPAVNVRHTGEGNPSQLIYFNSDGELDTETLINFCGNHDGYVTRWYDQSGNQNDATQTTASKQPKIYDKNEGVILENDQPTTEWTEGRIIGLQSNFNEIYSQPNTFFIVHKRITNIGYLFDGDSSSLNRHLQFYNSIYAGVPLNGAYPSEEMNKQNILTALFNTTDSKSYINSQLQASGNTGTFNLGGVTLGNRFSMDNLTETLKGTIQEFIIYTTNQSINKAAIENNINKYYKIY